MWKNCKEYFCIDNHIFNNIIKFWKKYKAIYIVMMTIIFFIMLSVSNFYKKEGYIIIKFFKQIFQIRL